MPADFRQIYPLGFPPGYLAGLLRRGSPVINYNGTERGVVVSLEGGGCIYVAVRTTDEHPAKRVQWFGYTARSWQIDLTDPTGRAHAAWWLASLLPSVPGLGSYHDLDTMVGPGSYEAVVDFDDPLGWDEEEADDRINAFVKVALWASNAVPDAR